MKREEAIEILSTRDWSGMLCGYTSGYTEALDMAVEALNTNIVWCKDCKYQDECEEIVLFDINDDEVMGHRVHWCSYGRSKK